MSVRPSALPSASRCQLRRLGRIREGSPGVSRKDRGLCRQSTRGTATTPCRRSRQDLSLAWALCRFREESRFAQIREIFRQAVEAADLRAIRDVRAGIKVESAISIDWCKFHALFFLLTDVRRIPIFRVSYSFLVLVVKEIIFAFFSIHFSKEMQTIILFVFNANAKLSLH